MTTRQRFLTLILVCSALLSRAESILIPMDETQANHLKAYGIAYFILKQDIEIDWLLNYRSGSFMVPRSSVVENECRVRGVTFEVVSDSKAKSIQAEVTSPNVNMNSVKLLKPAKIVVYSPLKVSPANFESDDAVLLVLNYAEIPFELVYDEEILKGDLAKYDWLHLHHEDFTGQFGRNMQRQSMEDIRAQEDIAKRYGFKKVSQMKLEVARKIKEFIAGGGYLFAMCSAAETLDIALAADGVDIVGDGYDGDGIDPNAQSKLDFTKTFAFENFTLDLGDGYRGMSFSDINTASGRGGFDQPSSYFSLFDFSAKTDLIASMLTQDHETTIREFFGQTTAFRKSTVKSSSLIMGTSKNSDRYIHGELGNGQWTFYGGHDPEGMRGGGGFGGFGPGGRRTDLNLYPHSAGYRLILNNVLFPSAKKQKKKT